MLIRSQNKKELHNLDGIKMIKVVTNSQDYFVEVNSQHTIGTYSTEEKALKVLDMICDTCRNIAFIDERAVVFQMPQDDDAEEGKVIAEIRLCNLEVTYLDADAKTDGYAQEAIKNAIMHQKIQKHMTELEQEIYNYEKDRECLMDYDAEISVCARTQNRLKEISETKIIERYKG